MARPLLLTGGPAAGKSTVAAALARTRAPSAFIDVDDIRQLVVGGHAAPWEGAPGARQQQLGVQNSCALARNFRAEGIDVVLTDVVTDRTAAMYRAQLPGLRIIWLDLDPDEARRRAGTRPMHLSWAEFATLHEEHRALTTFDERIDVTALSVPAVLERIAWS
ncbi:MAG TPA: AAA family ATPase [Mycobacteriales bacterium]|nr:AAA family ATPase [Mycobacteriales bacterium]